MMKSWNIWNDFSTIRSSYKIYIVFLFLPRSVERLTFYPMCTGYFQRGQQTHFVEVITNERKTPSNVQCKPNISHLDSSDVPISTHSRSANSSGKHANEELENSVQVLFLLYYVYSALYITLCLVLCILTEECFTPKILRIFFFLSWLVCKANNFGSKWQCCSRNMFLVYANQTNMI